MSLRVENLLDSNYTVRHARGFRERAGLVALYALLGGMSLAGAYGLRGLRR